MIILYFLYFYYNKMTRVKRGYVARKRRNRVLECASGFRRAHSRLFRPAKQQVMKALVSSKRDRGRRKRDFRKLWISRINASVREQGLSYSRFINKLHKSKILINRKMIAQIAVLDKDAFMGLLSTIS
jgi:large subunit ribosomal protein L20